MQVVDVEKYYSELYENVSFQLAPLCDQQSLAAADPSFDQIINTRTEGGIHPRETLQDGAVCHPHFLRFWNLRRSGG